MATVTTSAHPKGPSFPHAARHGLSSAGLALKGTDEMNQTRSCPQGFHKPVGMASCRHITIPLTHRTQTRQSTSRCPGREVDSWITTAKHALKQTLNLQGQK